MIRILSTLALGLAYFRLLAFKARARVIRNKKPELSLPFLFSLLSAFSSLFILLSFPLSVFFFSSFLLLLSIYLPIYFAFSVAIEAWK